MVIYVLFPLVIWTGLAMSPAVVSAFPATVTLLGGQQSARTIHFFVSIFLFLFLLVHIVMVCVAGFKNRMRAMITGRAGTERSSHEHRPTQTDHHRARGSGWRIWPRRSRRSGEALRIDPARFRWPLRSWAKRSPTPRSESSPSHSMAREFPPSEISNPPFVNGSLPKVEAYRKLQAGGFADWKLAVDGMVARPATFSIADLKSKPSQQPDHASGV